MGNPPCRNEYLRRIHAVQDYIEAFPDATLDLQTLADVAGFSKYHFHRIFHAITKETLLQYVTRIKLTRAASYLVHTPYISITDIAYHFGFADSAVFSRSFKAYYGVSPSAYRRRNSKNCKDDLLPSQYTQDTSNQEIGRDTMNTTAMNVDIQTLDLRAIYTRHTGSYQELTAIIPTALQKLYGFAMQMQLLDPTQTKILSAYHDNPNLTDEKQLRTSICITIKKTVKMQATDDIGVMDITGDYAVGHFELGINEYGAAWQYMYEEWLPNSGYQPRDTFPFEVYVSDPSQNPGGNQKLDIYIPIEPLGAI